MQEYYDANGNATAFKIVPQDGYKIHISSRDTEVIDEISGEKTGEIKPGYTTSFIRLCYSYDFETNPLDIYALPVGSGEE